MTPLFPVIIFRNRASLSDVIAQRVTLCKPLACTARSSMPLLFRCSCSVVPVDRVNPAESDDASENLERFSMVRHVTAKHALAQVFRERRISIMLTDNSERRLRRDGIPRKKFRKLISRSLAYSDKVYQELQLQLGSRSDCIARYAIFFQNKK